MTLTRKQYEIYKSIVRAPNLTLAQTMELVLQNYYNKIYTTSDYDYIFTKGEIPIAIIAHMDTVYPQPPTNIYYDTSEDVIWSPQGGIGDDRVGIFLIYLLLQEGFRPHIFLMNDEEYGGLGAQELVKDFPIPPFEIQYFIELDRQGNNEAVFYDCENDDFTSYVLSFGFKKHIGIFSDISIICPYWKIAGVNLSVGYYNEHSLLETWHPKQAFNTYNKVKSMLGDQCDLTTFEYLPPMEMFSCACCGIKYYNLDLIKTVMEDGTEEYLCPVCISKENINWCPDCGKAYIGKERICRRCLNVGFDEIEI